jgi:ribonucleoside-diphosphate reductase alpha chain
VAPQTKEKYEVTDELKQWLEVYRVESEKRDVSIVIASSLAIPLPFVPSPLLELLVFLLLLLQVSSHSTVAFKRRYLTEGTRWKYEYVVDATADRLIGEYGVDPEQIDTALKLSGDYERRIKFQADVQDYVDMSISSTINLPRWGSKKIILTELENLRQRLRICSPASRIYSLPRRC